MNDDMTKTSAAQPAAMPGSATGVVGTVQQTPPSPMGSVSSVSTANTTNQVSDVTSVIPSATPTSTEPMPVADTPMDMSVDPDAVQTASVAGTPTPMSTPDMDSVSGTDSDTTA